MKHMSFHIAAPMLIAGVSEISGNRAALQVLPVNEFSSCGRPMFSAAPRGLAGPPM